MAKHGRRHSFDLSYSQNEEFNDDPTSRYEQEKQRKVHFDDEYLTHCSRKQQHHQRNCSSIREMNVYETTSKLKESYNNIDNGLDILRRIYDNLIQSKQSLRYRNDECSQNEYVIEINGLLEQVERLQQSLEKSGDQKRQYLQELTRIQSALREDRLKIEAARESRQDLHAKMNASTKATREQQITINKLKHDNQNLWQILQEVKKHLIEEEQQASSREDLCISSKQYLQSEEQRFPCSQPSSHMKQRNQLPEIPKDNFKVECDLYPSRDDDLSSNGSSQDILLAEKLKYLINRSENIQNMITKVGKKSGGNRLSRSYSEDCINQTSLESRQTKQRPTCGRVLNDDSRIPAENEHGERCDAKDIMRRCEELERRVEQCSTKDMRDRLMHQLEEIECNDVYQDSQQRQDTYACKEEHRRKGHRQSSSSHSDDHQSTQQWHPEIHKRVRNELFKCLDQMSTMEKNFSEAQSEIARLRQYIKQTTEQKEFHEKTFKREALQLRLVVDEKAKEVDILKQNLNDAIKGLRDSEDLISRNDELESLLEEKEKKIKQIKKDRHTSTIELQEKLDERSSEMETMKLEMKSALETMERLRVSTTSKEKATLEETISTEISLLQTAVFDVENRMKLLNDDNVTLRQDIDEKLQILGEITVENEELIQRLLDYETQIEALRSSVTIVNTDQKMGTFFQQDERIRQLEAELSKALSEKESILNSSSRNTSYIKIDKTADEQEQLSTIIESLIDDNEKHLETIQQKDRIIENLQSEIRKLSEVQVDGSSERPEMKRYLDIIRKKNKTIDEMREKLDAASTEADKKLINDLINTLSSTTNESTEGKRNIQDELKKIRSVLSSSHKDLVDKIIVLEEGLSELKQENKSLRNQMAKESKVHHVEDKLDEKLHKVVEENATLRDSLNRPYPGLVQNILSQSEELKRLHEENELLRLGLSENKRELVDSNLRKRQRIKDLQLKVEEYEGKKDTSGGIRKPLRKLSPSGGDVEDNVKSSELVHQIHKQNAMLQKLEEENQALIEKSTKQMREIKTWQGECDRLAKLETANKTLEFEVKNLRETLKDISIDDENQRRIHDLEKEVQDLKGCTPTSPVRDPFINKDDLHRLAKIAREEKKKCEELTIKVEGLNEERRKLKKEVEVSENNKMKIEDELRKSRQDLSRARSEKKEAKQEIATLRELLQESDSSQDKDGEIKVLTDDLNTLQEDRVMLQNKLERARKKNILLDREVSALKSKLQEDNAEAIQQIEKETHREITELNRELDHYKQENKELQEINDALVEEMERMKGMKSEINELHFKKWLDQDVERRLALLSPDTHRSDLGLDENDKQYKKDQQRLIRKLQIENQVIKAKLLSLEEENIASTQIVSDMERGHGHLTGMLRSHLILQQNSTAKLLENSLQQYTTDYENLKKKFASLEEKYSKQKKEISQRRDDIWELFTNAGATITNINTILNEGLVKVEDDLEKDMGDDKDFEDRDYKSRLWILRRRLSDVENRHRELQLRAEELNLRLDAKQTEFEVTQDELEDATRDLESRENHVRKLGSEIDHLTSERSKLNRLMSLLKENEDRNVGDIIAENENLVNQLYLVPQPSDEDNSANERDPGLKGKLDLSELIAKLKERDAALSIMRKMREETEKENDELKRRINYIERKLKEVTSQRDKLQKEAEYRAGYMSFTRDDHGTIHMLRDDLKRIAKENADLKHDIVLKQRQMYDMSKDLHKLRIKLDADSKSKKGERSSRKEEVVEGLIQDLAASRAEGFILEAKLKDLERRIAPRAFDTGEDKVDGEVQSMTEIFKQKLAEKEREIEKLKRGSPSRSPVPRRSPMPAKDDTMSDVISAFDSSKSEIKGNFELKKKLEELKENNRVLHQTIADQGLRSRADLTKKINTAEKKISQQRAEISSLSEDNEQKRKRIRELLTAIEQMKDGHGNQMSSKKLSELVNKTKEDEMESVMEKLQKSKGEVEEWKSKAESYQKELGRVTNEQGESKRQESIMDQPPPLFFGDDADLLSPAVGLPQATATSSMHEQPPPLYLELHQSEDDNVYEEPIDGRSDIVQQSKVTLDPSMKKSGEKKSQIPISPSKRIQTSGSGSDTGSSGKSSQETSNESPSTKTVVGNTQQPTRRQWEFPRESNQSESQVRELSRQLEQTVEELDIYRTNLNMNEHETLELLGNDRLNYAIEFQISQNCMTELRTMQNEIYELEHENETLQSNYVNLADSFNEFNDSMQVQLEQRNNEIKYGTEKIANENLKLQDEIKTYQNEIGILNQQLSNQNRTIRESELQICAADAQIKRLEEDLSNENETLKAKIDELITKEDQIKILEKEKGELLSQFQSKTEENEKLTKKQKFKNNKNQELKKVKEDLEQKKKECQNMSDELKKKSDECVKLQRKAKGANLAEKNRELKRIRGELLEKTKELQDITEQLEDKIKEVNKLKKQLDEKNKEDESTKHDLEIIENLRQELSASIVEITKRNEIIQELRVHVDKVKQQETTKRDQSLEQWENTEVEYQEEIQKLKDQLEVKESESESYLDETVKALENAKKRLVTEISSRKRLDEEVKSLKEKIEKQSEYTKKREEIMKKELFTYKNDLLDKQRAESELAALQNSLKDSEEVVMELNEQLNEYKEKDASEDGSMEIREDYDQLHKELQLSESRVNDLEKQLKERQGVLEKEKDDSKNMKITLDKELDNMRAIGHEFESYRKATEQEIAHSTSEMYSLKKKIARLEAEKRKVPPPKMPSIEEEIVEPIAVEDSMAVPCYEEEGSMFKSGSDLEVELEILQGCNEELEQRIESLQKEVKTLENTKDETSIELERTREDLKKSLDYLGELNEKNTSVSLEHEDTIQELQNARNKIQDLEKKFTEQENQYENESSIQESKVDAHVNKLEAENTKLLNTIEQMEDVIDQLEDENLRKDRAFEKLRKNNESNITEMENVMRELEEENIIRTEEHDRMKANKNELQNLLREKEQQIQDLQEMLMSIENTRSAPSSRKTSMETIIEQGNNHAKEEIEQLQQELEDRISREKVLEDSLDTWIRKSKEQASELDILNAELEELREQHETEEEENEIAYLTKQNETFKLEIDKKNNKLQAMQEELAEKDEQYQKILASLHKRRDESKRFLAMQETLRNEIDSKEDLIRKLNFKIKSNDLDVSMASLNTSREDDLDQSDGNISTSLSNQTTPLIVITSTQQEGDESNSVMLELSSQLKSARNRNKQLSRDLEKCRADYIKIKDEKEKFKIENEELFVDIDTYKDRISDLRNMIQGSPNATSDDDPNFVGFRTKLYASYQELREKSVEIASLRMCIEIKDDEIESLKEEIEQLREMDDELQEIVSISSKQTDETQDHLACSHSDDIKALLKELNNREKSEYELQNQITELRQRLLKKCKQNDHLHMELSKVKTRFKDIEQKLCQDDQDLRQRFLHVFENDTSDISEVTPLNSVRLCSAPLEEGDGDEANLTVDEEDVITPDADDDDSILSIETYSRIKDLQLKAEEDKMFYKEQVTSLHEEIGRLNEENSDKSDKLEHENNDLKNKLTELQTQIEQIQTTKNDVLNKMRTGEEENKLLENKLTLKEQRHYAELDHLKTSLMNAKNEHLSSVKKRMESNFQEKILYQFRARELEQELRKKEKEVMKLKSRLQL